MKRAAVILGVVLVGGLFTSPALAQRGGMGAGRGMGGGRRNGNNESDQAAAVAMPEPVNAVNLLIMHLRELALPDTVVRRVVAIKRHVDSTNTPLLRRFDSLQAVIRQLGSRVEYRDSVDDPRILLQRTVSDIRVNIEPGRVAAYALLSPEQLDKAKGFEATAEQKYAEQERAAMARGTQRGKGG